MKICFTHKLQENGDIWSFYFRPLDDVRWIAGQSIRLEVPKNTWGTDERRFTIASAPHEKHLRITTRKSTSSFKKILDSLVTGDIIHGYNVEGDFVWGSEKVPRLFIAGGIGITPFRAMIAQAIHDNKELNSTLIYISRHEPILYQLEYQEWQRTNTDLQVIHLHNRFDFNKQSTSATAWLGHKVYISGPSKMVDDVSHRLVSIGIPEKNLYRDWFTGLS